VWQLEVSEMALLKYFSVKNPPAALPIKVSSLSVNELQVANSRFYKIIEQISILTHFLQTAVLFTIATA